MKPCDGSDLQASVTLIVGRENDETKKSDAGSQYRCGRVGRGIQPLSTPQPTPYTQTHPKSIESARFPTFQLDHHDGRTDGRTDGQSLL